MSDFKWHKMADERPQTQDSDKWYLVIVDRKSRKAESEPSTHALLYLADGFSIFPSSGPSFYVRNTYGENGHWLDFDEADAWAEIPNYNQE